MQVAASKRKQANHAFLSGDWQKAIRLYTAASKALTDGGQSISSKAEREMDAFVHANRAQAWLKMGKHQLAELDATHAMRHYKEASLMKKALFRRAQARYQLGEQKNDPEYFILARHDYRAVLHQPNTVAKVQRQCEEAIVQLTEFINSTSRKGKVSNKKTPPLRHLQIVQDLMEDFLPQPSSTWYAVSNVWMEEWKTFAAAHEEFAEFRPIDNSDVLCDTPVASDTYIGGLKEGCQDRVTLLPEMAWTRLREWYSVLPGHDISRPVAIKGCVELYPVLFTCIRGEEEVELRCSLTDKVSAVVRRLADSLHVASNALRLHLGRNMEDGLLQPQHLKLTHFVKSSEERELYIEERLPTGAWPSTASLSVSVPTAAQASQLSSSPVSPSSPIESPTGDQTVLCCAACKKMVCVRSSSRCGQCHVARYCSREHQRSHWKYHKQMCKHLTAARLAAGADAEELRVDARERKGFVGLVNMGNSCYMSSAVQCLSATPSLVSYFLGSDHELDINEDNVLGTQGRLARSFGLLLKELWFGSTACMAPREFRQVLAGCSEDYAGFQQHDSQEFLGFLLDRLHEDLNRIKDKPYISLPDSDGRADSVVAQEHWKAHIRRNQSHINDLFLGQYRSALQCNDCKFASVSFDAFMTLSLPVPDLEETEEPAFTARVLAVKQPCSAPTRLHMPSSDVLLGDLLQRLPEKLHLQQECEWIACHVRGRTIAREHDLSRVSLSDLVTRISVTEEKLPLIYAFAVPMGTEEARLAGECCAVFVNFEFLATRANGGDGDSDDEDILSLGRPCVLVLRRGGTGAELHREIRKMLLDAGLSQEGGGNEFDVEDDEEDDLPSFSVLSNHNEPLFEGDSEEPLLCAESCSVRVLFHPLEGLHHSDAELDTAVYNFNARLAPKARALEINSADDSKDDDTVSLEDCLKQFTTPEELHDGEEWYCKQCKTHRKAVKEMRLWRLPSHLIIHLKRFKTVQGRPGWDSMSMMYGMMGGMGSSTGMGGGVQMQKISTPVRFPLEGLDLSAHIPGLESDAPPLYDLYAVSHHYGRIGFGHYTASVLKDGTWWSCDDDKVTPIKEEELQCSSAYLLFYKRRG